MTKPSESMREALSVYKAEMEEREDLIEKLIEYRDGCSDGDWLIIQKAITVIRGRVEKMRANHDEWSKKNER